ncbi:putative membrane protein [Secundilactobacillus oryzae JCM 18671]|uniref:Putative membrane protein n=1 Tax=Secundilactobacillus oryzae JCM 18671 TaxID=1291743 RepID=A0A081BIY4_9LACO|nr:TIGR01906 family membrane protein [Secundilactobacillus oryzae]GAK48002.1 putative membrane protein [Secundilactobacillus oryzae JCM 18671]
MINMRRLQHWGGVVLVILCMLSLAIFLTVNSSWLFRLMVGDSEIVKTLGLSTHQLMKNYGQLLSFLQLPWVSLDMTNFPTSFSGMHHFEDVKKLILFNNTVLILTIMPTGLYLRKLYREFRLWLLDLPLNITAMVLLVASAMMAVNFNQFFIGFHELFFRNQDWLFDPQTDPIILVLPENFFYACFALAFVLFELQILAIWLMIKRQQKKALKH